MYGDGAGVRVGVCGGIEGRYTGERGWTSEYAIVIIQSRFENIPNEINIVLYARFQ